MANNDRDRIIDTVANFSPWMEPPYLIAVVEVQLGRSKNCISQFVQRGFA